MKKLIVLMALLMSSLKATSDIKGIVAIPILCASSLSNPIKDNCGRVKDTSSVKDELESKCEELEDKDSLGCNFLNGLKQPEEENLSYKENNLGYNTTNNPQSLQNYSKICLDIMSKATERECLVYYNKVLCLPFRSTEHRYCDRCSYQTIIEKKPCPSCRKPFKQETLELRKRLNQCVRINYQGKLIWLNKDFVWLEDTFLKDYPKEEEQYKCGSCDKGRSEPITFLLCGCGKNPLCIPCWKKQYHHARLNDDYTNYTISYQCPNCRAYVTKSNITLAQKCLNVPIENNPIIKVQKALKQGNVNLARIHIQSRQDSIQAWVDERWSRNSNTMSDGDSSSDNF